MTDRGAAPPCGWLCSDCPHLGGECPGCRATHGRPFWTAGSEISECPVFVCCTDGKDLEHCGLCPELPCGTFREWHDPSMTAEEVTSSLEARKSVLLERARRRGLPGDDDIP